MNSSVVPSPSVVYVPRLQRRSCYVNFAEHLLNAFNPNVCSSTDLYRWTDAHWFAFVDMIADMGFTHFEFWLTPRLFCRQGIESEFGQEFVRQFRAITEHARTRGVGMKLLAALTTVGDDWHTHCPNDPDEWAEVCFLWDQWASLLPGMDVIALFPGDPGGCSLNGCNARTFVDSCVRISQIVRRRQPAAQIEIGTWGTPFWGWGTIKGPPGWKGEFIQSIQHSAWTFDEARADDAMTYLIKRLPEFPSDTSVAINLGFSSDGDPDADGGRQDARPWAREIAKTNAIVTWGFSLTEGENAVIPHYRFDRLFAQRRRERDAAPYSGGICFTMTPMLNQLSLYQSAQSFMNPDADPTALTKAFYTRMFGPRAAGLVDALPLFEIIPDWGNHVKIDMGRGEYHRRMRDAAELLRSIAKDLNPSVPLHPSPESHRRDLLFYFELFADLSGPSPDLDALHRKYWQRVYAIYDLLPTHVDPRPRGNAERLINFFTRFGRDANSGPVPGKWTI